MEKKDGVLYTDSAKPEISGIAESETTHIPEKRKITGESLQVL